MSRVPTAGLALVILASPGAGWNTRNHDARRTGQADVAGPSSAHHVWRYVAEGGLAINMEPAVTAAGVFFGTWGVLRQVGPGKGEIDKGDGRVYGLDPDTGRELWPPLLPAITPHSYRYDGRAPTPQDAPAGPGLHLSWHRGTVEGTAAVDPGDGTLYFGRGDGRLHAVDPQKGTVRWSFRTFDPARPDDPEGGGEIVGGPLIAPGGRILFATLGLPERPEPPKTVRHETNAVYAVDRTGRLLWRYPPRGGRDNPFLASLALSPSGDRAYAATWLMDTRHGCEIVALDPPTGRVLWRLELPDAGVHDLAVGELGPGGAAGGVVVYAAGMARRGERIVPAAFALADRGESAAVLWGPDLLDGERADTHFAGGLALREEGGRVTDVYVSTTHVEGAMPGRGPGRLHRLDPATGRVRGRWDPGSAAPSATGGLTDVTLDRGGTIYVGARGRSALLGLVGQPMKGRMYALTPRGRRFEVVWSLEVDGLLDWASPAIGPKGDLFFGSTRPHGPAARILPHAVGARVKDADPVFYGVRSRARR